MTEGKPDTWLKMAGDAAREIGILYLVFGVLDAQIERRRAPAETLDIAWFAGVSVTSVVVWSIGALMERLRRE